MKILKVFVSFSFVLTLIFSVLPLSAYAADEVSYFNFPFSQPQVTDRSGYIEVLFETSSGYRYVRLFQWQTSVASDWTELDLPVPLFLTINKNGLIKFQFEANSESVYYSLVTIYDSSNHFNTWQNLSDEGKVTRSLDYDDNIVSFNIYGTYAKLTSDMTNTYIPKFSVSYGDDTSLSDITSQLVDINNTLLQLHSDNLIFKEDVEYIQGQLTQYFELLHSDNVTISEQISDIATWITFISDQLNDFSDRVHTDLESARVLLVDIKSVLSEMNVLLANIDSNVSDIAKDVDDIYEYLRRTLNPKISNIELYLKNIRDYLKQTVSNNLTSPDTSDLDGYLDAENSLLNNSNVDVSDVVKVEVNQNALTVIWDLVQGVFDQSGKVFGMVLTVLSLGLVAMVLGRKV